MTQYTLYTTSSAFRIGEKIHEGGGGTIHPMINNRQYLVKVLKNPSAMDERIVDYLMTCSQNPNLAGFRDNIAFPCEKVYESNGKFVGFIMRRLEPKILLIDSYAFPERFIRPVGDTLVSYQMAYNLSNLFDRAHRSSLILGDMNPLNFAFGNNGAPILFDTDGFSFPFRPCPVDRPEYRPSWLAQTGYGEESDNFGLAIHIYKLIMGGTHPFASRVTDSSFPRNPSIEMNLSKNRCVSLYGCRGLDVPLYSPNPALIPPNLRMLFIRAFSGNNLSIPKPSEWINGLDDAMNRRSVSVMVLSIRWRM